MAENADKEKEREVDPVTGAPTGPTDVASHGTSGSSITGTGPKTNRGTMHNGSETAGAVHDVNFDPHAQSNLGGRSPGLPQTTIGDQDSTQNRNDMQMIDPMTSRAPADVNRREQERQEQEKQKAAQKQDKK